MAAEDWTTSLAIRAAWLSFIGRRTQGEIAEILGVSAAKVHRLIAQAQREGLIKFFVEMRPIDCIELESKLCELLGLKNCFIAPDLSYQGNRDAFGATASFAGQFLHGLLSNGSVSCMGVGMGRTLTATVEAMPKLQRSDLAIVSITGSLTRRLSANPYDVVQPLQAATGGEGFYLPVPYLAETVEEKEMFHAQRSVQDLIGRAEQADLFVIGIGSVSAEGHLLQRKLVTKQEADELAASDACTDMMGRFYDRNGDEVDVSLNDKAVGLHPEKARGSRVVAVVGGADKAEATLGAVRTGVITDLIMDEVLARDLLVLAQSKELAEVAK
ncbi:MULTISPECIES: sugar-binding transcriptional regulator [Pseudovibrio]|uniref:sugar-binding transcriptional regulator n=1 Tax=Stappiaceae TaxID=2821832 RepID=UPI0023666757|nr:MULTISPECIES: sugar-binding domain-containing protein [Pseudovibrio]MDD7910053.1 sugar-binding domain-containing protein [Pseudovibrio exalbescens]MDX5592336.1 sugar-binding domain-containing protein [Pseudovibrio sp. SPO723]